MSYSHIGKWKNNVKESKIGESLNMKWTLRKRTTIGMLYG